MADLIDRDDLLADIAASVVFSGRNSRNAEIHGANKIIYRIKDAPTIDAEPVKHGWWIGSGDGYADGELVYDMWECSECGYDANGADEEPNWNYCPNCGARMDGDGND